MLAKCSVSLLQKHGTLQTDFLDPDKKLSVSGHMCILTADVVETSVPWVFLSNLSEQTARSDSVWDLFQ